MARAVLEVQAEILLAHPVAAGPLAQVAGVPVPSGLPAAGRSVQAGVVKARSAPVLEALAHLGLRAVAPLARAAQGTPSDRPQGTR